VFTQAGAKLALHIQTIFQSPSGFALNSNRVVQETLGGSLLRAEGTIDALYYDGKVRHLRPKIPHKLPILLGRCHNSLESVELPIIPFRNPCVKIVKLERLPKKGPANHSYEQGSHTSAQGWGLGRHLSDGGLPAAQIVAGFFQVGQIRQLRPRWQRGSSLQLPKSRLLSNPLPDLLHDYLNVDSFRHKS